MTMDRGPGMAGALFRALSFAADKHRKQRRKDADASPYINHPIAMADLLINEAGVEDPTILCAAVLHDTIEDTETTPEELERVFGHRVAAIVQEVSYDKSLDRQVRKRLQVERAPFCSREAKLVKLADKICNLRDTLTSAPAGWSAERKRDYFEWAARVVVGLEGAHSGLEAKFEEVYARRVELD